MFVHLDGMYVSCYSYRNIVSAGAGPLGAGLHTHSGAGHPLTLQVHYNSPFFVYVALPAAQLKSLELEGPSN